MQNLIQKANKMHFVLPLAHVITI